MEKVLIANRGEVAARVDRAVRSLGWIPQHIHVAEDAHGAHVGSILLPGQAVAGYLDIDAVIDAAVQAECTLLHPGWGFLSESQQLAQACSRAGIVFVGPTAQLLGLFGDKASSRAHAELREVPVLPATTAGISVEDAREFLDRHPDGVMIKAVAGGGGRGMRSVTTADDLATAFELCRSEAARAFGNDQVYAEKLMARAKHIEVQILGDASGRIVSFGERECSVQRQHQKLIEYAPSPALTHAHRAALFEAAQSLFTSLGYMGLATVEFLVNADTLGGDRPFEFFFIEVNPRLQVEHTVTEAITGRDLVATQLQLALGKSLAELGVGSEVSAEVGRYAIQVRVNCERREGPVVVPTTGTITELSLPSGARVDTFATVGSQITGTFDSLLAKIIVTEEGSFEHAARAADEALSKLVVEGVQTNAELLRQIVCHRDFVSGRTTTNLVEDYFTEEPVSAETNDPREVAVSFSGTVVSVAVEEGQAVGPRTPLLTIESMKMEYPVIAGTSGLVTNIDVALGDQVLAGQVIATLEPVEVGLDEDERHSVIDLEAVRPDLAELFERRQKMLDSARPEAVSKRHRTGHRTARENLAALVEPGTFLEYGSFPVAAQRGRRSLDDLIVNTPADGIITGTARIGEPALGGRECAVVAYDYTVLAGTQGYFNHKKTDRIFAVAKDKRLPVVLFGEGGGGRPGDTDTLDLITAGLNVTTFATMASLSGVVPTVGVLTGRSYAGNAALLGCCDVIIATRDSNVGMAGPAMIEGGGLGRFAPEDIGPMSVQGPNGVVDLIVDDDAQAVDAVKKYLSYFDGSTRAWSATEQLRLRHVIGENRKEIYDIRELITILADEDSVLELRAEFGTGAITALVRVEGRSYGLVANNPAHLGGAIDADAADKMARFLQLCDAHGLGVISLCDTPGFMVGPDSERTATVRHFSRLFVIGAHLRVPMVTIVLRKGYGLGAQAMASGGFSQTLATVAWPTGEIGGMGLEGAVRLGFSKELAAIDDEQLRHQRYVELLDAHYEMGKAINGAMKHEFDEVIDPAESRRWIVSVLGEFSPEASASPRYIDTW